MILTQENKMTLKNSFSIVLILVVHLMGFAQIEKPPTYPDCPQDSLSNNCFIDRVSRSFEQAFKAEKFDDPVFTVIFSATKEGAFQVLYVKTTHPELKQAVEQVFDNISAFNPATYNGHPIDQQFILSYPIDKSSKDKPAVSRRKMTGSHNPLYDTPILIPYSQHTYRHLDPYENSSNAHTAVKPYTYKEVQPTIDFDSVQKALEMDKTSWFGRKFWNENMLIIQDDNYWFHLDPIADLQVGKDNSDNTSTYNNTRAVRVEGGLGKNLAFSSTLFENQGRFADYFNRYARAIKPTRDAYAVVPGRDISKHFKDNGFDYPMTTGYLSLQAMKQVNIQFGHDRNFIGDGYRSLFLSDVGAPYTFLKFNTKFWKIQYTNLWTWLRDTHIYTDDNEPYKRKYMALHYLSWNATKKLNIGLFESVVWAKSEDRGFDVQYLNPVIFYRALEFSNGSKAGNAMLGLSLNYQLTKDIKTYSQFLLDELTMKEFVKKDGYWANKYGIQLGLKYYNAFKVPNLYFQAEYNQVRPYTYSHSKPEINYGHVNQPLAHLWGSNFREFIFITDYQKNRWFGNLKLNIGTKGFDYNTDTDSFSYGGDIFKSYTDRNDNYNIRIGQGNKAKIYLGEFKAGYLINPATNLKIYGSLLIRDFKTPTPDAVFENKTTTWFSVGFRTDINNWYFDF